MHWMIYENGFLFSLSHSSRRTLFFVCSVFMYGCILLLFYHSVLNKKKAGRRWKTLILLFFAAVQHEKQMMMMVKWMWIKDKEELRLEGRSPKKFYDISGVVLCMNGMNVKISRVRFVCFFSGAF